jgi:hypothetical protein
MFTAVHDDITSIPRLTIPPDGAACRLKVHVGRREEYMHRTGLINALVQAQAALLAAGSDLRISGAVRRPLLDQAHMAEIFVDRMLTFGSAKDKERVADLQRRALRRFQITWAVAQVPSL